MLYMTRPFLHCLFDTSHTHHAGNTSAILVASDADAAAQAARQVQGGKYGFVWTQLYDLSSFYYER